jgi:hypothetical protein
MYYRLQINWVFQKKKKFLELTNIFKYQDKQNDILRTRGKQMFKFDDLTAVTKKNHRVWGTMKELR